MKNNSTKKIQKREKPGKMQNNETVAHSREYRESQVCVEKYNFSS